jgi:hypothetical protein
MDPIFIVFTALILLMFLSARIQAAQRRRRLGRSGGSFVYDMFSSSSDSYLGGSSDAPHSGHHHGAGLHHGHHHDSGHHGHSHTGHDAGGSHADSGSHGGGFDGGGGGHSH